MCVPCSIYFPNSILALDESDLKVEDIEKELESEKEAADRQAQQDEQTDKDAEDMSAVDDQDAADNEGMTILQ